MISLEPYCNLHARMACTLCDECGHDVANHVNAHDQPEPARRFAFDHATCWAESVCDVCDPDAARELGDILGDPPAVRGQGDISVEYEARLRASRP